MSLVAADDNPGTSQRRETLEKDAVDGHERRIEEGPRACEGAPGRA